MRVRLSRIAVLSAPAENSWSALALLPLCSRSSPGACAGAALQFLDPGAKTQAALQALFALVLRD
jgi:hypothetical protein